MKDKKLRKSKKFWSAIVGGLLAPTAGVVANYLGCTPDIVITVVVAVAGIFGVQINAQGSADKANAK